MCESHDDLSGERDAGSRRATPGSPLLRVGRSLADPGARVLRLPPSLQVLKRGNHFGITIAELLGSSASPEGVASAADRVTRSAARVQCLASASTSMRSSHGCCARHASMLAALLGAFDACVRRRWRWCAAHQGWRPLWRARSRDERLHVGRSALRPGPEPTRTGGVRKIFGDKTPYYGVYPSSMVLGAIWCRNPHEKRLRWARELYSTVNKGRFSQCVETSRCHGTHKEHHRRRRQE